ncbi:MAG TPA: DUF3089 domain-containing protein [Chitinophagaceae bacterium]
MNAWSKFIVTFIATLFFVSSNSFSQGAEFRDRDDRETPPAPDYSSMHSWASHPFKHDFGDSIPKPLRKSYSYDSTIDVFFIHPTTYIQKAGNKMNGDVNNESLNARTDRRTILNQATVFNEFRLFAPRYRQANYSTYLSFMGGYEAVFDTAYTDIKEAFQYYLDNWNKGRPFFIASHSQGTQHGVRLIGELIKGTELERKLVAAYIIGMPPVMSPRLDVPVCKDSTQTGCYVAWNSFSEDYTPIFNFGKNDLKTVNPLTWTVTDKKAASELHKGAVVNEFNSVKPQVLSAHIRSGRLIVASDEIEIPARLENLHVLDINLFYVDIRNNLKTRAMAYRKNISITAN